MDVHISKIAATAPPWRESRPFTRVEATTASNIVVQHLGSFGLSVTAIALILALSRLVL